MDSAFVTNLFARMKVDWQNQFSNIRSYALNIQVVAFLRWCWRLLAKNNVVRTAMASRVLDSHSHQVAGVDGNLLWCRNATKVSLLFQLLSASSGNTICHIEQCNHNFFRIHRDCGHPCTWAWKNITLPLTCEIELFQIAPFWAEGVVG